MRPEAVSETSPGTARTLEESTARRQSSDGCWRPEGSGDRCDATCERAVRLRLSGQTWRHVQQPWVAARRPSPIEWLSGHGWGEAIAIRVGLRPARILKL